MKTLPRLVVASNNSGKIREFRDLLHGQVEVVSMADLGFDSPEETESTFECNAELKARNLFEKTGEVTLADDSGLEIEALQGMPGVLSARYAGGHGDDAANRQLVLHQLQDFPIEERGARFVAAIVVIDQSGTSHIAVGTCDGSIGVEERGHYGFGYDSIFVLPNGTTMAELTATEKGLISHRAKALTSILPSLRIALGLLSDMK